MIQRCFAIFTRDFSEIFAGRVDSQYLAGSGSLLGHSIKSHSSGYGSGRLYSRWAGRTRTAGTGGAKLSSRPCANRSPSMLRTASRGPTPSQKWVDDLHRAAGAWEARRVQVFALTPAKAIAQVPRLLHSTQCLLRIASR